LANSIRRTSRPVRTTLRLPFTNASTRTTRVPSTRCSLKPIVAGRRHSSDGLNGQMPFAIRTA
jgi:hypothetical protein